jgi:hypothetical protein
MFMLSYLRIVRKSDAVHQRTITCFLPHPTKLINFESIKVQKSFR